MWDIYIYDMEKRKLRKIEDEEWQRIEFADDHYEISNYGRVKSFYGSGDGKILKCGNVRGFQTLGIKVNGEKKQYCVHKLTAMFFIKKDSSDQTVVIHKDWNKSNNNHNNLKWVTSEESYKRMHKRFHEDRKLAGHTVTNSKLKEEDIILLKTMLKKGVKQNVIAKLFAISEMQVTRIKRNENWAHIIVPDQDSQ